jgi:MFS family permease
MVSTATPLRETVGVTREERKVIFASSLGTVFEWYDFFLYGSLAAIIGATFFGAFPPATQAIFALLAFAAGSVVRTFGALAFGRVGDRLGRKYTFLVTILIMGLSTSLVGLLPGSATIGLWAPIVLIVLRLLQGLALGGEYGGAAIYVAEHAPSGRRGFYTSWIQTTATLGLFLSFAVILGTRSVVGEKAFEAWGWRVPFLFSCVLLCISVWIRLQLDESPVFRRMKLEGKVSKAPLTEAFGRWSNVKIVLIALFGLVAGQAVVWYVGQFYVLFFLQNILKVDSFTATLLVFWSLFLGSGFFVVFGWLSDKVGRKPIIIGGCLLAAVTYFPIFKAITERANPALAHALEAVKVAVVAEPARCGNLFNPVGTRVFTAPCDLARAYLAQNSVRYDRQAAPAGESVRVLVNGTAIPFDADNIAESRSAITAALQAAGYPKASDPGTVKMTNIADIKRPQVLSIIGLLFVLAIYVTMVYGPMAAVLVELFPARIRYSGLSLPYHVGNGWFGGLLPAAAVSMVAQTGDIYFGLWYPIVIAVATFIIGLVAVPETKDRDITNPD